MKFPINLSTKNRRFRHLRRALSLRYTGPILAALIMTYGPYIKIKTADSGELEHSLLSLVPDSTLKAVGRMRRPYGMGEWQFASYIRACAKADISPQRVRPMQTIGNAKLSAGVHAQDGIARDGKERNPYCAAVDLRTRGLTNIQILKFMSALTDADFAGFYRFTGSFTAGPHIHTIFAPYPMKRPLRIQVRDFISGKNGLKNHARETFYQPTPAQKARIRAAFLKRNA